MIHRHYSFTSLSHTPPPSLLSSTPPLAPASLLSLPHPTPPRFVPAPVGVVVAGIPLQLGRISTGACIRSKAPPELQRETDTSPSVGATPSLASRPRRLHTQSDFESYPQHGVYRTDCRLRKELVTVKVSHNTALCPQYRKEPLTVKATQRRA